MQRLDLLFDVMGFMQLLQSATMSGNPRSTRMEFPVVPNMLGMVLTEERWSGNNEGRPIAPHEIGACTPSLHASAEASAGTSVDTPPAGGESQHPRIITLATPPFTITHVNAAWCDLCGYCADEAIGKTLSMIQGTGTDRAQLRRMMHDVKHACASSATITNYRKDGSSFLNYVRVYPLTNDEGGATSGTAPSHYLGVLESLTIAGA
uniref:PAS domain-containing protein n=1 Tax=Florenciella parvula TaxID=236787 RepID=A0A7S2CL90_9STRA